MSGAPPASSPARRAAPAARPASSAPVARTALVNRFDHHEDEFRLHLNDIPRMRASMDIEGLKPTLLSRLFDLVAPLRP
jgi:hypothetical protein